MIDTEKLRPAVSDYWFHAKSAYFGHKDAPVTMRDMNKTISETVSVDLLSPLFFYASVCYTGIGSRAGLLIPV